MPDIIAFVAAALAIALSTWVAIESIREEIRIFGLWMDLYHRYNKHNKQRDRDDSSQGG